MNYPIFDREQLIIRPLNERENKVIFERDLISPLQKPQGLSETGNSLIEKTAERIREAKEGRALSC